MFSKKQRSEVMSKIRSKNTKAELVVFSYLRKSGYYFQRHYSRVPGKPDIALPRKRKAVFVDGDFWHGRNKTKMAKLPAVYWRQKIQRNLERDRRDRTALIKAGWRILMVCESDLLRKKTQQTQLDKIVRFLRS